MFLQDSTAELIDETVDAVEAAFDEDVYKTDVVEAMIVAGGENTTPETVLRRWGYGMKNR
jgi:glutamine amidotransferase PdxT